jgi:hypothetical protein
LTGRTIMRVKDPGSYREVTREVTLEVTREVTSHPEEEREEEEGDEEEVVITKIIKIIILQIITDSQKVVMNEGDLAQNEEKENVLVLFQRTCHYIQTFPKLKEFPQMKLNKSLILIGKKEARRPRKRIIKRKENCGDNK